MTTVKDIKELRERYIEHNLEDTPDYCFGWLEELTSLDNWEKKDPEERVIFEIALLYSVAKSYLEDNTTQSPC